MQEKYWLTNTAKEEVFDNWRAWELRVEKDTAGARSELELGVAEMIIWLDNLLEEIFQANTPWFQEFGAEFDC